MTWKASKEQRLFGIWNWANIIQLYPSQTLNLAQEDAHVQGCQIRFAQGNECDSEMYVNADWFNCTYYDWTSFVWCFWCCANHRSSFFSNIAFTATAPPITAPVAPAIEHPAIACSTERSPQYPTAPPNAAPTAPPAAIFPTAMPIFLRQWTKPAVYLDSKTLVSGETGVSITDEICGVDENC